MTKCKGICLIFRRYTTVYLANKPTFQDLILEKTVMLPPPYPPICYGPAYHCQLSWHTNLDLRTGFKLHTVTAGNSMTSFTLTLISVSIGRLKYSRISSYVWQPHINMEVRKIIVTKMRQQSGLLFFSFSCNSKVCFVLLLFPILVELVSRQKYYFNQLFLTLTTCKSCTWDNDEEMWKQSFQGLTSYWSWHQILCGYF